MISQFRPGLGAVGLLVGLLSGLPDTIAQQPPAPEGYQVEGVRFLLNWTPAPGEFQASNATWFGLYKWGKQVVEYRSGQVHRNGIDYGNVRPGDVVRLSQDGTITINDKVAVAHPIQGRPFTAPPRAAPRTSGFAFKVAWGVDGQLQAILGDGKGKATLHCFDVLASQELSARKHPEMYFQPLLAVSPNGARIATGSFTDETYLWDSTKDPPQSLTTNPPRRLRGLAFATDALLVEVHDAPGPNVTPEDGMASVRTLTPKPGPATTIGPVILSQNVFARFAVSGDGKTIARLESCPQPVPAPPNTVYRLVVSQLSIQAGTLQQKNQSSTVGFSLDMPLALSHDGTILFAERSSQGRELTDTATGMTLRRLFWRGPLGVIPNIAKAAFSPDRTLLAIADNERLRLYDVASGRELGWFAELPTVDVAFSHDGKYLAAACRKTPDPGGLRVWEVATLLAPQKQ